MNKRVNGTPWKRLRRRNPPQIDHEQVAQATARFLQGGRRIRKLAAEIALPRTGPGDRFDFPYIDVLHQGVPDADV